MRMRRHGVHTSIAGGLHMGIKRAHELRCSTVQIFSHNPRSWLVKDIPDGDRVLFGRMALEHDISPVYVHASYLINISSSSETVRGKSAGLLREEMQRADAIGADFVVLHPGSSGDGSGMKRALRSLREALGGGGYAAGLLIENTSGKRGDIASTAEELKGIMDSSGGLVSGICIDTCHAFAAGYDLLTDEGREDLVRRLGGYPVRLIHLNDAKGGLGSGLDRHEHLGMGRIGKEALGQFLSHGRFRDVPVILETPKKAEADDVENLKVLRDILSSGRRPRRPAKRAR